MHKQKCLVTLYVTFYCIIANNGHTNARVSTGVYRDNGIQTVLKTQLSVKERNTFEKDILTMIGVPLKVMKSPRNLNGSATQFLLNIYKFIEPDDLHGRKTRSVSNVNHYDDKIVQDSDIIVTLYLSKHVKNLRHEHGKIILFELKDVPSDDSHMITSAEIHLYKSAIFDISSIRIYTVTLYKVLIIKNGEKELEFVSTQNITTDYDGWLRFNTTGTLISWTHYLHSNKGLYVSVHSLDNKDHEVKPEEIGMVTWADKHQLSEAKKPFMAVYLKSRNGGNKVASPRLRKHINQIKKENYENKSNNSNPLLNEKIQEKIQYKSCQKEILYVSFKDLEWQDWIIAPDGYGAYYCTGECNFPLSGNMNATNHAIVQTLIHLMNPLKVPKPCCAPTKMTQQSVLFFLEDNNVILKKYKNMIVKSCGCH